jgi:LAO/AO transport system kinase
MSREKQSTGALSVQQGVPQPPSINPEMLNRLKKNRRRRLTADDYVDGILRGDRTILSQAITLTESSLPEHYEIAQAVVERCLPASSRSVRVGITGVPGAGKSTFIDTFGTLLTRHYGRRLAVLAIDPSSQQSVAASWVTRPGWSSLVQTGCLHTPFALCRYPWRSSPENTGINNTLRGCRL